MKHLTTIIIITATALVNSEKCERIKIDKEFYKRQLIATIDGFPTGLVIDTQTYNIFFVLNKRNYTRGIHLLKHGSLGAKALHINDDLTGQCIGIDANNIIYIGTNQGILTYDYSRNVIPSERPIGDDDVRRFFFDNYNQMHIITGPNNEVFTFVNGTTVAKRFEQVPKAYDFVIDTKGNIFYEYVDGRLYFLSKDLFEPVQYKGFSRELKYILELNHNDEAILAVKNYLYKLSTNCMLPTKIANLGFKITGLAFDNKNNIIIGTKGKIYRYKPIDSNDPCTPDDYLII